MVEAIATVAVIWVIVLRFCSASQRQATSRAVHGGDPYCSARVLLRVGASELQGSASDGRCRGADRDRARVRTRSRGSHTRLRHRLTAARGPVRFAWPALSFRDAATEPESCDERPRTRSGARGEASSADRAGGVVARPDRPIVVAITDMQGGEGKRVQGQGSSTG